VGRRKGEVVGAVSRYIVKFAPSADRELEEAARWYAEHRPAASAGFRSSVIDAVELISNSPLSWRQVTESGVRRIVVDKYPYTVYFEVLGDMVYVLSVAHHRKAPKYTLA
jgi:toxin ParE1/3/4